MVLGSLLSMYSSESIYFLKEKALNIHVLFEFDIRNVSLQFSALDIDLRDIHLSRLFVLSKPGNIVLLSYLSLKILSSCLS